MTRARSGLAYKGRGELRVSPIDALLLDIQMPGLTGLEAAELLPEGRPLLVLCTAHAAHTVRASDPAGVTHAVLEGETVRLLTLETSHLSADALGDVHARLGASFERVHRRASAASADQAPHRLIRLSCGAARAAAPLHTHTST